MKVEFVTHVIDLFMHLDVHLISIIQNYGAWTYLIVFIVIFGETGLVVTPFLPGDSLLFVLGTLAASGSLEVGWLAVLLSLAAILGNTVNYWIGHLLAPKVFNKEKIPFLKREYLERTERFYEKYGNKTIIITRFIPIVRTFAPFMAGVGNMRYGQFALYNAVGGLLWVNGFIFAGYFFGNLPLVKDNLTVVIYMIIFISILPGIIEYLKHRRPSAS